MQLSEIITHFKNVKPNGDNSYMACCPYHGDEHQSLSISEKDGKILLNCFAGCDYHNVLWAAGLCREKTCSTTQLRKIIR